MTTAEAEPTRPRTDLVPPEALLGIVSERTDFVGSDSPAAWNHQPLPTDKTFGRLPTELSKAELAELGFRLCEAVEQMDPSGDGISHGRAAEERATYLIGRHSINIGDMTTAFSSAERLRELGGLGNNLRAYRMRRLISRRELSS